MRRLWPVGARVRCQPPFPWCPSRALRKSLESSQVLTQTVEMRFFVSWANPKGLVLSLSPEEKATMFARMNVCARKHFPIPHSAENPDAATGSVFVSGDTTIRYSSIRLSCEEESMRKARRKLSSRAIRSVSSAACIWIFTFGGNNRISQSSQMSPIPPASR